MMLNDASGSEGKLWEARARQVARGIRLRVLEHTLNSKGGYLSQTCSAAELFATLYVKVMDLGPSTAPRVPPAFRGVPGQVKGKPVRGADYNGPVAPDCDRFFLSPGHYALVEYATLIETGRLAPDALTAFNQDGSTLEMIGAEHSPGFEVMSGSLSQALSVAGGVALARKVRGAQGKVWVFMSDGEMEEGQIWEAFSALSFYKLDNIGVYIDANGQQCDGKVDTTMNIEPLKKRLEAFGALVAEVDGHSLDELAAPAGWPREGKPLVVIARTNPCQGMDILENRRPFLHYIRFKSDQEFNEYASLYRQMAGIA